MLSNQDNTTPSHVRFTPSKDSQFGSLTDVGTKPTGNPRSTKDFKKVLRKNEKDEEEPDKKTDNITVDKEGNEVCPDDTETKKPESALSLFDLTRGKQASASELAVGEHGAKSAESPSDLFSKLSSKQPKKVAANKEEQPDFIPVEPVTPKKEKFTTRFDTEQTDLSYVNPLGLTTAAPQAAQPMAEVQIKKPMTVSQIQEIIDQMVKSIQTIDQQGKTDTVLTLKHPPIFEGANLIITAYDNAKGEFNLAFENLTQAAKQLLDMRINQESLRQALEQRGYAVHIVVTTTLVENRPIAEASPANNQEREDQGKGEEQKDQEERKG